MELSFYSHLRDNTCHLNYKQFGSIDYNLSVLQATEFYNKLTMSASTFVYINRSDWWGRVKSTKLCLKKKIQVMLIVISLWLFHNPKIADTFKRTQTRHDISQTVYNIYLLLFTFHNHNFFLNWFNSNYNFNTGFITYLITKARGPRHPHHWPSPQSRRVAFRNPILQVGTFFFF